MIDPIPFYDALYSISDLHLGGDPGMQMFAQGKRLGGFLTWLAGPGPGVDSCALVLAGDVIDSLPRLTLATGYLMVDGAAELVRSTFEDAFPEVLAGVKTFVRSPGRELIILIGNHDLELALPEAQTQLLALVAENDVDARGRIRFATNGTGFRCRVGGKTVYVTHGNEADAWNHVDHEALRIAAHRRALGLTFEPAEWMPNAGTKLVVDAMNGIKRIYPFVDLLKPETAAMLKILAVLDERRMRDFYAALPAFMRWARARMGPPVVLGEPREPATSTQLETIQLLMASEMRLADGLPEGGRPSTIMDTVRRAHLDGKRPEDLVSDSDATLNILQRAGDLFRQLPQEERMRQALLDWTEHDRTFDLKNEIDDVYRGVMSHLGAGIDVVITGHTHLPRWIIPDFNPRLTYLNAGTWARVIGLSRALLNDTDAFSMAYKALISNQIERMDTVRLLYGDGQDRRERALILDATLAARVQDGRPPGLVRVQHDGTTLVDIDRDADLLSWT